MKSLTLSIGGALICHLLLGGCTDTPHPMANDPVLDALSKTASAPSTPATVLQQYTDTADFLTGLQTLVVASPDFGGIQEHEQYDWEETDNTQEAIWVWSRTRRLTGTTAYDTPIGAAWSYVMANPGPLEGGDYAVWNSAWGLYAEMEYRSATGDDTFLWYAEWCADYILASDLTDVPYLKVHLDAFTLPALYRFGKEQGEQDYVDHALERGQLVKEEVETSIYARQGFMWVVNGGTAYWAVMETVFQENPEGRRDWALQYYDMLPGVGPTPVSGANEWPHTLWSAAGQMAAFRAGVGADAADLHRDLVEAVLEDDGDGDGGVPKRSTQPDTMDESWVSAQLMFNGVSPLETSIDIEIEPDTYTVSPGTDFVYHYAERNNLDSNTAYTVLLWAKGPGTSSTWLGTMNRKLRPGQAADLPRRSFPVPAGTAIGDWTLYAYALLPDGSRADLDSIRYQVR